MLLQMLLNIQRTILLKVLLLLGVICLESSLPVQAETDIYQNPDQVRSLLALSTSSPNIAQSTKRLIFNDVQGGAASVARAVTLRNTGNVNLTISSLTVSGTNADQFQITQQPLPVTIAPGSSAKVSIAFNPTTIGSMDGLLQINSNDPDTPQATVSLRGLGTKGLAGKNEPSLQWILDTYQIPVNVGDSDPTDNFQSTETRSGDEISLPQFQKAGTEPVKIELIGVFSPKSSSGIVAKFGYYSSGNAVSKKQLFTVPNASYQSLRPTVLGSKSFDPGIDNFGFYSSWPFFNNRNSYSEDHLNTSDAIPHQVRVYPLKEADGTVVANAYILAIEEHTNYDYQDFVVIVRNVKPATTAVLVN